MLINADFSQAACVVPDQHCWVASPQSGVARVMLDRVGDEVARATSLVRYAPASVFPPHTHGAGEEILVLSGTFSDESGDFGAGWYVRNPPGSRHQPLSREGALIFVKLRQMPADEAQTVRVDSNRAQAWQCDSDGVAVCPLFASAYEQVCLRRLPRAQVWMEANESGLELLVLSGTLQVNEHCLPPHGWLRLPPGIGVRCFAGQEDVVFYIKTNHLKDVIGVHP